MSLVEKPENIIDEIIEYLTSHPDFFLQHPDLLYRISMPHFPDQDISSLIEYQVRRLRQQNTEIENRYQALQKQSNVDILFIEDVLDYSLELYRSRSIEDLLVKIDNGLNRYYSADRTALLIFSKPGSSKDLSVHGLMSGNDKTRFMFTELFHRNRPLCDSLQEEHLKTLFGKEEELIASTVLLPVQGTDWQGLLVLGSYAGNSYRQGIELDMLIYIGSLIQLKLKHFID